MSFSSKNGKTICEVWKIELPENFEDKVFKLEPGNAQTINGHKRLRSLSFKVVEKSIVLLE